MTTSPEAKLVSAERLLEILFDKACRPSLRWVRDMQKQGRIPFAKCGAKVFFDPAQVRAKLFPDSAA